MRKMKSKSVKAFASASVVERIECVIYVCCFDGSLIVCLF